MHWDIILADCMKQLKDSDQFIRVRIAISFDYSIETNFWTSLLQKGSYK